MTISDPFSRLDGPLVVGPAFRTSRSRANPPLPRKPVGARRFCEASV